MAISYTVPTLELGIERSDKERLTRALETLPPEGYALLRSPDLRYRAVSKSGLGELVVKMSSPSHRLHFTLDDPICVVTQREEFEAGFASLAPPSGRVVTIRHSGSVEIAHTAALATSSAGITIYLPYNLPLGDLMVPKGPLFVCPELRPEVRPPGQPLLERDHKFDHFPGFSICSRCGEKCNHVLRSAFGSCPRCGSKEL